MRARARCPARSSHHLGPQQLIELVGHGVAEGGHVVAGAPQHLSRGLAEHRRHLGLVVQLLHRRPQACERPGQHRRRVGVGRVGHGDGQTLDHGVETAAGQPPGDGQALSAVAAPDGRPGRRHGWRPRPVRAAAPRARPSGGTCRARGTGSGSSGQRRGGSGRSCARRGATTSPPPARRRRAVRPGSRPARDAGSTRRPPWPARSPAAPRPARRPPRPPPGRRSGSGRVGDGRGAGHRDRHQQVDGRPDVLHALALAGRPVDLPLGLLQVAGSDEGQRDEQNQGDDQKLLRQSEPPHDRLRRSEAPSHGSCHPVVSHGLTSTGTAAHLEQARSERGDGRGATTAKDDRLRRRPPPGPRRPV